MTRYRSHVRRWTTAATVVLLAPGCLGAKPNPLKCPGVAKTVYDPFRHVVCMDGCYDDFECPRGTLCAKSDESATHGACKLPSRVQQTSHSVLLDGFGVREMPADLRTADALELAWTAPEGARIVNCVLLSCPPAFRISIDDGVWAAPTDASLVEIANYDRCALASEQSTQPSGLFNLREKDNAHPIPKALASEVASGKEGEPKLCRGYGCAPISELYAGCWAYDDTTIVAATRLFPIDIGLGIYNYHGTFARDLGVCSMKLRSDGLAQRRILEESFFVCRRDDNAGSDTSGTTGDTAGMTGDTTGLTGDTAGTTGDGTDSDADSPGAAQYGVCACEEHDPTAGPPTPMEDKDGNCIDPEPCKRPCLSDCDCGDDPLQYDCERSVKTIGYCVGSKCMELPAY